jgi:hypothetical protein
VVRLGRVERIRAGEVQLEAGTVDAVQDTLFVDCAANGLARYEPRPLFSAGRITLESTLMCQQTFSAALIAHLELSDIGDDKRIRLCAAVPHPGPPRSALVPVDECPEHDQPARTTCPCGCVAAA